MGGRGRRKERGASRRKRVKRWLRYEGRKGWARPDPCADQGEGKGVGKEFA